MIRRKKFAYFSSKTKDIIGQFVIYAGHWLRNSYFQIPNWFNWNSINSRGTQVFNGMCTRKKKRYFLIQKRTLSPKSPTECWSWPIPHTKYSLATRFVCNSLQSNKSNGTKLLNHCAMTVILYKIFSFVSFMNTKFFFSSSQTELKKKNDELFHSCKIISSKH